MTKKISKKIVLSEEKAESTPKSGRFDKLSDDEVLDLHMNMVMDISNMARAISSINTDIHTMSHEIEQIELELDARENKKSGRPMN